MLQFVSWDTSHTVLFVVKNLFFPQGAEGVPFGGPLSTQLSEFWATHLEREFLFGDSKDSLMERWREERDKTIKNHPQIYPAMGFRS